MPNKGAFLKQLLKCTKLTVCDSQSLYGKKPHILIDTLGIFLSVFINPGAWCGSSIA